MTTLPQTTPIRLPRAGGNSQLAMPVSSTPSVVAQGPGMQMSGGDVWRVIRANLWLIIVFVVLSGVGGFFANRYLEQHDSAWTSYGKVRMLPMQSIDPIHPSPMFGDSTTLELEKATEMNRFKSEVLVEDMLKDSDNPIRQTFWWKVTCGANPDKAHELLAQNLSVDPQVGSQLMKISFTAPDRADTPVIVTAVVERAILDQQNFILSKYDSDRKRIADYKIRYDRELRTAQEDVKVKSKQLVDEGGDGRGGYTTKDTEVNRRVAEQIELESQKLNFDNAYTAFIDKKKNGEVPARVLAMVEQDPEVLRTKDNLDGIQFELSADDQDGSNSPRYKNLLKTQELQQKTVGRFACHQDRNRPGRLRKRSNLAARQHHSGFNSGQHTGCPAQG